MYGNFKDCYTFRKGSRHELYGTISLGQLIPGQGRGCVGIGRCRHPRQDDSYAFAQWTARAGQLQRSTDDASTDLLIHRVFLRTLATHL